MKLLAILLATTVLTSQAHAFDSPVEQQMLGPVAKVTSPSMLGSGFFITPEIVVTARHVINDLGEEGAYVYDSKGTRHRVVGKQVAYDSDVGIITVDNPDPNQQIAKIKCEAPKRFDTLVAAGSPLGVDNVTTPQMVVGFTDERDVDDVTSLVMAGGIDPGMSGGPLYNLQGEVVAIVSNYAVYPVEDQFFRSAFFNAVPLAMVEELCPTKVPVEGEPALEAPALDEGISAPGSEEVE